MKLNPSLVLASAWVLALSACSTLKVQKDEVAKINKVAVVGFSVIQDNPPTPELSFGSHDNHGMSFAAALCKSSNHAQLMLDGLDRQLASKMKWSIADLAQVNQNKMVQERLLWQKSSFRPAEQIPVHTECFVSSKVPEEFAIDRLDFAQRKQLIESLGVDGIVVVEIRVEYENSGILKIAGSFKPRSTLYYRLYNAKQEDPIWLDSWARGEPTAEGTSQILGMVNEDEMNAKVVSSAQSAYQQLMTKYSE